MNGTGNVSTTLSSVGHVRIGFSAALIAPSAGRRRRFTILISSREERVVRVGDGPSHTDTREKSGSCFAPAPYMYDVTDKSRRRVGQAQLERRPTM